MIRYLVCGVLLFAATGFALADDELATARKRWAESPHGPMLERILPPGFEPQQLPQRASRGAQLTLRYCVQCHNLPNPAMHHAAKWPAIVERMVLRMRGRGNMGTVMSEMMAGVAAPGEADASTLLAYLKRNAQQPLDARKYPEVNQPSGEAFKPASARLGEPLNRGRDTMPRAADCKVQQRLIAKLRFGCSALGLMT